MPKSRRRRRVEKIGGGGAARPAQGSTQKTHSEGHCVDYIKINDILIITVSVVMSMNTDTVQCARRRDNVD